MFRSSASTLALGFAAIILLFGAVAADIDDSEESISTTLDNGLGSHIEWHSLDDGLALAKQKLRPLMLIIHKSWCGACKALKPKFQSSKKIANLSKNFIMVNTMDHDEPPGDTYRPDGGYVPRLLFFDPLGDLIPEIINEGGNPQYKYYYYDEDSIVKSMEKVDALFPLSGGDNDINENEDDSSDRNQVKSEL